MSPALKEITRRIAAAKLRKKMRAARPHFFWLSVTFKDFNHPERKPHE
jgi:hypothetical protein